VSDTKLIVAFAIVYLASLAAGGGLLVLALHRGDGPVHPPEEGGRGPKRLPDSPRRPDGGPPMPIARPAVLACENPHASRTWNPGRSAARRGSRSDRRRDRQPGQRTRESA
jgi:hypothetical protein